MIRDILQYVPFLPQLCLRSNTHVAKTIRSRGMCTSDTAEERFPMVNRRVERNIGAGTKLQHTLIGDVTLVHHGKAVFQIAERTADEKIADVTVALQLDHCISVDVANDSGELACEIGGTAIDLLCSSYVEQIASTEKIRFGDPQGACEVAVARLNGDRWTGRPTVANSHEDRESVFYADRIDLDFLKDLQIAELACRLLHPGRIVCLTSCERQLSADDVLAGTESESVHGSRHETRSCRCGIKDIVNLDDDRVDNWRGLCGLPRSGRERDTKQHH